MGLKYGYNASDLEGKWYAEERRFIKWYDSEEEMNADKYNAFEEYNKVLETYSDVFVPMVLQYRW